MMEHQDAIRAETGGHVRRVKAEMERLRGIYPPEKCKEALTGLKQQLAMRIKQAREAQNDDQSRNIFHA